MEEENKKDEIRNEEPKQKSNKVFVIVIVIIAMALTFGCGIILGQKLFEGNKENKNTVKEDKKEEVSNNTNTVQEIEIDDNIMNIYKKYHTVNSEDGVGLSSLTIEEKIYNKEKFEISELQNKDISFSYGNKIYENIKDELEKKVKYNEDNEKYFDEKDVEEIIQKGFNNFFSDNLTFNHDTMNGCHTLSYHEGKYYITPQCGDTTDTYSYNKIFKAEKDQNNLYIYEAVSVVTPDVPNIESKVNLYIYKWTYNLKSDGNYYFLRAERVK